MRKFAKPILLAAGFLLLFYALAILGLNIYLQSKELQERVRVAAESASGNPVRIRGTHYTPWSGFSITGVVIGTQTPDGRPPLFEAAGVSFRFSLLALIQGRLQVSEVVINSPSFASLLVRQAPPPQPAAPQPVPEATPQVGLQPPPPTGIEITVPEMAPPAHPMPPPIEVKAIRIVNGSAEFFDSKGAQAITLAGVEITGEIHPDRSVTGSFRAGGARVGALVHPKRLKGTFTWKNGRLQIPDLHGDWAGGELTGTLDVSPEKEFSVTASAAGVLIKKLAADAGIDGEGSRGSLLAKGELRGTAGKPETFEGRVEASLQEARFQPLDFIRQIGDLLSIQELQMLELKTAEAVFNIRGNKVAVDTLVLESENLLVDAKGPVGFDGKIKLQARLLLNDKLRKNLSGLLTSNFKDSEREGYQEVPFSISGNLSRPKTDLLDKLTGFRIGQDVGGILKNLFKAPPEKKKDEPASAKQPGGD